MRRGGLCAARRVSWKDGRKGEWVGGYWRRKWRPRVRRGGLRRTHGEK